MNNTFMYVFHAKIVFFNADWDVFGAGLGDRDVCGVDVWNVYFVACEYRNCNSSMEVILL
jgi:hypothetical protein